MSNTGALLVLAISAGLTACAGSIRTPEGDRMRLRSEEFAAYAEDVFRQQNEVLDALAFALDEQPDEPRLLRAEDSVLEACAGLNEMAVRRRDAESVRPLRGLRVARRIPECARAAAQASELLRTLEP
jgi:hypothetical protein